MRRNRKLLGAAAGILLVVLVALLAVGVRSKAAVGLIAGRTAGGPAAQTGSGAGAKSPARIASLMDAPLNRTRFPDASLKVDSEVSFVGRSLKIQGSDYPPRTKLDLVWGTKNGSFKTGEQMEFYSYQFAEKDVPIASVTAGADGKIAYDFVVPEDYGGVHNVYALYNGEKVMQAGVNIRTEYSVSPLSGPSGTPIHIKVTGIGYAKWEELRSVAYDNQFTGFLNGVLTKGTATATIRAAGGVGRHIVRVASGAMLPYMNVQQSPNYFPGRVQDFVFTVTSAEPAAGTTAPQVEWRNRDYPDLQTNAGTPGPNGERIEVTPNVATVGTALKLSGSGFAPNTTLDLQWEAMRGNRNQGWSAQTFPLDKVTTDAQGSFERSVKMPEDLGGSHSLLALADGKKLADTRVVIEPSFLDMTPARGPAGTDLKIVLKGVGWTEVDNVYIMTYDNSITGYSCGFNSGGDITINMKATGALGWHYIDLWPSVYLGHIEPPWVPNIPWLSFQSHPGLPKPAFHLAFEVTQ